LNRTFPRQEALEISVLEVLSVSVVSSRRPGSYHTITSSTAYYQEERMAHQCRVGPARGQWERVNNTGPPAANITSTTDTNSTSSTDSATSLGKVGFKTLDAQAYFSYDLNFAGKPEEWTRTFYNGDYAASRADISRLIMR
jgi:hypothetical protein